MFEFKVTYWGFGDGQVVCEKNWVGDEIHVLFAYTTAAISSFISNFKHHFYIIYPSINEQVQKPLSI